MPLSTSYNIDGTKGAREDLSDQLKRVQPHECPLFATLPQTTAPKAILKEWLSDTIPNPEFATPAVDGVDKSFDTDFVDQHANRARLSNRVQKFDRTGAVSPLASMISVAGPQSSLLSEAKARALLTLRTDVESAIGSSQVASAAVTNDPTPSNNRGDLMQGLFAWSDPNGNTGSWTDVSTHPFKSIGNGVLQDGTVGGTSRYDATTNGDITEAIFRQILQSTFEASGKSSSYKLFAGPKLLNSLTNFSRAQSAIGGTNNGSAFNVNTDDGSLRLSVVKIISDYGEIDIIPSLFLNRTSGNSLEDAGRNAGILIPNDDSIVSLAFMEPINTIDLADIGGGGDRFLLRTHLTLQCLNARALASIV
jgi:hypothetical protein